MAPSVVYKNKEVGTRAVRYKGTDEPMRSTNLPEDEGKSGSAGAHQQPKAAAPASRPTKDYTAYNKKRARSKKIEKTVLTIFCLIMAALSLVAIFTGAYSIWQIDNRSDNGYYTYEGSELILLSWELHEWENDSWRYAPDESWMESDYESYYDSYSYDSGAEYEDFEDSSYYTPYEYSDDNNDSWDDDSWDSGWDSNDSWDSGYDDWGSDW